MSKCIDLLWQALNMTQGLHVQAAMEAGIAEEQNKAKVLEDSLAQAQAGLETAQSEKQALQKSLEELQENLYNQVSCLPVLQCSAFGWKGRLRRATCQTLCSRTPPYKSLRAFHGVGMRRRV